VNILKQLGLALQTYQATFTVLPPGCVDAGGPLADVDEEDRMSWIVSILPSMEQGAVFSALNFSLNAYDVGNQTSRMSSMATLLCPSSNVWLTRSPTMPWTFLPPEGKEGLTSYVGCHHDDEAPIDVDNSGLLFRNSRIRPIDVTDGLSQTILLGESAMPSLLGWISGSRSTLRNTGHPINSVAGDSPVAAGMDAEAFERAIEIEEVALPEHFVGGFGSRHGGGANFALGDGSVRFLTQSIEPSVLRLLGNRSDGEVIDDASY
jgi:prepilin-type processing-associated H-X9-DG protein